MIMRCPCGLASEAPGHQATRTCPGCGRKLVARSRTPDERAATSELDFTSAVAATRGSEHRRSPTGRSRPWLGLGAAAAVLGMIIITALSWFAPRPDPAAPPVADNGEGKSARASAVARQIDKSAKPAAPPSPASETAKPSDMPLTRDPAPEPPDEKSPSRPVPVATKEPEKHKAAFKQREIKLGEESNVVDVLDFDTASVPYRVYQTRAKNPPAKKLRLGLADWGNFGDYVISMMQPDDAIPHEGIGFRSDLFLHKKIWDFDYVRLGSVTASDIRAWKAADQLRAFVARGGAVYGDFDGYDLILAAFPEMRPEGKFIPLLGQDIPAATVRSPKLQRFLGAATAYVGCVMNGPADGDGRLPHCLPAEFNRARCTVHLDADYVSQFPPNRGHGALLASFRHEKGMVFFSCLNSPGPKVNRKIMEFVVFSMLNTRAEAALDEMMKHTGRASEEHLLGSAKKSVRHTIEHATGSLVVGVGFNDLGARFVLKLTAPDGKVTEHASATSFLLEAPAAATGVWSIDVTAIAVPFANFPVSVVVGRSKE